MLGLVASLAGFSAGPVSAETLREALERTYSTNPELNAERARVRVVDEGVPQARGLYRPQIFGSADAGIQAVDRNISSVEGLGAAGNPFGTDGGGGIGAAGLGGSGSETTFPRGIGVTIQQDIFTGFRRSNTLQQAEVNVQASRETLRNVEQNVLLAAVEAYMNVLRDLAIVRLTTNNVGFLEETLGATRDRFDVGEVTRTDVAQSEAALGRARSDRSLAEANLAASRATYRQIVGVDPINLAPGSPIDSLLPNSLDAAIGLSRAGHPAIMASNLLADSAQYAVNIVEGELLPTVSVEGNVARRYTGQGSDFTDSASVIGRINVPIYQGGITSSRVRQAKEELGQRRIEVDFAREQVQAAVVSAWGGLESARAQIEASQAEVQAGEVAVAGVREEASVGQRTTLDVLESQQALIDAQVRLTTAQRDRVVASYALLSAIGRLSAPRLNLAVREYKPEKHYEEVRDKWFGLRTPAGQ